MRVFIATTEGLAIIQEELPMPALDAFANHDEAERFGKSSGRPFRIVLKPSYIVEPVELSPRGLSRDHYNYIPVNSNWIKVTPKGDGGQSVTVE